ncbi:anti-repressor SinI family protein [Halobacillus litoralis]|nr:anti-repressor SinI family protein [Halobacillus litoralis]
MKNIVPKDERIDDEWVHLLKEAKDIGLSKEEVKNFLRTGLRTCKTV